MSAGVIVLVCEYAASILDVSGHIYVSLSVLQWKNVCVYVDTPVCRNVCQFQSTLMAECVSVCLYKSVHGLWCGQGYE